jgi:hypothetical protein
LFEPFIFNFASVLFVIRFLTLVSALRFLTMGLVIIYVKKNSVSDTKIVSDIDFLFTFNVYHMADKYESYLVVVSNESEE